MIDLQPEPVYHPIGGMNIDSNGISARPTEAVDCVNVDITAEKVVPRAGTKLLDSQGDAIGPVLKYHRYDHPIDGTLLFAFCSNGIYQYDVLSGWTSAFSGVAISGIEQWSVTNCIDRILGSAIVAAGSSYTQPASPYADASDRLLLVYDPTNTYEYMGLQSDTDSDFVNLISYCKQDTDFQITFSVDTASQIIGGGYAGGGSEDYLIVYYNHAAGKIQAGCGSVTSGDLIEMAYVPGDVVTIRIKATGEVYNNGALAGTCVIPVSQDGTSYVMGLYGVDAAGLPWNASGAIIYDVILDGIHIVPGGLSYFYEVDTPATQYPCTEYVASAPTSTPATLVEVPTGETRNVGFVNMQIKKNTYDTEDYAGTITAPSGAIITESLTAGRTIVAGTAYLIVDTVGVIATAGLAIHERTFGTTPNLEGVEVNLWLPVDADEVRFGEDSYIRLDTGAMSVDLIKGTYNGLNLIIVYQFEEDVDYKPLHVTNYHSALMMANTVEYFVTDTGTPAGNWVYTPWRTRWSEQGNIFLFKERNYQDLALDDISPILGLKSLETVASSTIIGPLYFYKLNSIIRAEYNQSYNLNPDFPVPMLSFEIAYSEGVQAINTITNVEGKHFYLGRNDVYAFDGVNRVSLTHDRQTGTTRVQNYIFKNLNLAAVYRSFGIYDEINRKYFLFLTFNTAAGIYPEDCMVYDIDLNQWSRYTYNPVSAGIVLDSNPGGAVDNLTGTVDALGGTIDSLSGTPAKYVYLSIGDHTYYTVDTPLDEIGQNENAFSSYIITKDFLGQTLEEQDRVQKVMIEGKTGDMDISYSGRYDTLVANFLQPDNLNFTSHYRIESYHPDAVVSAIRFLIVFNNLAEFRWMQVFSKKQEFTNE